MSRERHLIDLEATVPYEKFVSFAQNHEDVLLHRVLAGVAEGTYVEVGANHPTIYSISHAFSQRGWSGLLVEPAPHFAALLRAARPRDIVEEAVAADVDGSLTLHMFEGTGLSTLVDSVGEAHVRQGRPGVDITVRSEPLSKMLDRDIAPPRPIHFMTIDTEGAELEVLQGIDFARHRPWVLVVEATAPLSTVPSHLHWEELVLASGYRFCLFDGLSRYYVAEEHAGELGYKLSYPVCIFDDFESVEMSELRARNTDLDTSMQQAHDELIFLRHSLNECELDRTALRKTVSWRVTRPLRSIRRRIARRP